MISFSRIMETDIDPGFLSCLISRPFRMKVKMGRGRVWNGPTIGAIRVVAARLCINDR